MEYWGPEVLKVLGALKRGPGDIATPDFPDLSYELRGNIPPELVYLVQNAQILPKVAKCCQVNGL